MAAATVTTTATVMAATTARVVAATAAATVAPTQPRLDGMVIQAICMCGKLDFFDKYPLFATRRAIIFQGEFDSNTKARPPERLKGQRGGGRRLLVVAILWNWQLRRYLCLLYMLQRLYSSST
jgi:hypothetical protein